MKKLDLVQLKNEKPYKEYNLFSNMHGIVVKVNVDNADILFFNPQNIGDYAIVNVKLQDLILTKEKLPLNIEKDFLSKMDKIILNSKAKIEPLKVKAYDMVELLVEDEKYAKFGIHKGEIGCVMDDDAIQNYIEVDFSGIDKNGNYYGDCISVKIEDVRLVE